MTTIETFTHKGNYVELVRVNSSDYVVNFNYESLLKGASFKEAKMSYVVLTLAIQNLAKPIKINGIYKNHGH